VATAKAWDDPQVNREGMRAADSTHETAPTMKHPRRFGQRPNLAVPDTIDELVAALRHCDIDWRASWGMLGGRRPCCRRGRRINSHTAMTGSDLLIVDDCRLYREGLVAIMARHKAVRTVHDMTSLLRALEQRCPDVILLHLASVDNHRYNPR
jgi:hypothetical protein